MKQSVFKSIESRDKFRQQYQLILSQFPFGQQFINTSFGKTFLLTAGLEKNPPVILLHGSCSNSAFWFPEIMALSSRYKVYAVDIIGEAGNSEEFRPDIHTDAFASWMNEVLDGLGLEQATLIGNSLGGWMALKFATSYPTRVSRLGLLASAGLAEIRDQFIQDVAQNRQEYGTESVDSAILGENDIPKEVLDFMNLIIASYNPIQYLPVFGDDLLKQLNMPVLFLGGEDDAIINAPLSAQRLSGLVPTAEVHLLENCGHLLTNSVEYVIPFLSKTNEKDA